MISAELSPTVSRVQPQAIFLLLLTCVFAVAAGYGWFGESRDYSNYYSVYAALTRQDSLSGYRFERGYMFLSWLCKFYAGMDFAQYYSFLVSVSLFLKFRLLWKHTSAPILAALVYLMVLFPFYEYTQLRAAVAFSFAYTAIDAYLYKRRFSALFLLTVATLFHTTAIVLGAATLLVIFVSRRSPLFAVVIFSAIAFAASRLVSGSMQFLEKANPLVSTYINKAFLNQPPNLFSGENILLFGLILSSALFLRPWRTRSDGFFYYLSFWVLITYVALFEIPVFAHRLSEAFIFSCFLFPFRFDYTLQSRIPSVLLMLTGGWMVYEAISEQWLFVYSR